MERDKNITPEVKKIVEPELILDVAADDGYPLSKIDNAIREPQVTPLSPEVRDIGETRNELFKREETVFSQQNVGEQEVDPHTIMRSDDDGFGQMRYSFNNQEDPQFTS